MTLPTSIRRVFDSGRLKAIQALRLMGSERVPALDELVRNAAEACRTPLAFMTFVDDRRQWIKASFGSSLIETTLDRAVCAAAIEADRLLVVPDCSMDPRVNWCPAVYADPPVAFYAGAPLRSAEGFALGTLCVVDRVPRAGLTTDQEQSLLRLAEEAMRIASR